MTESPLSNNKLTRRATFAKVAFTAAGLAFAPKMSLAATADGISYSAATIHQEPVFATTPKRVFNALTDPKQFQQVELLSAAAKAVDLASNPPLIGQEPGGAIKLFGGYISGWQLELETDRRIVEAWRSASWPAHVFSIVRFELVADGAGTKILFDHTGFPAEEAEHLAAGWKSNYWDALAHFLK